MSEATPETNLIWVLSTVIGGPLIAGITWFCTKKCKNTSIDCDSGCCKFHASEQVRETIREEIRREMANEQVNEGLAPGEVSV